MGLTNDPQMMKLLTRIHDEKGIDFTQYKEPTLRRRIESRMRRFNLNSFDEYLNLIDEEPGEYDELLNSLFINVTDFFRNPESFAVIEKIVIPRILFAKRSEDRKVIRAWSCGCSTGDEAYSLAMILLDKLGGSKCQYDISIIGTDIDKCAIRDAKNMSYTKDKLSAVSNEDLSKYFEKSDDQYRVKDELKKFVRFKYHDVIKDEPIKFCDIILCRNLLIYFNRQLQEEILLKLFECLNPGGFLVLGMVESLIGTSINHYEHIDNKLRIYRKPERYTAINEILSQNEIDEVVEKMIKGGS